ncbi:MAG: nuclear transport factor 2 family protein [Pseudomonadota bacterium]|nr:nuclear transport factor 2 family protein [Pseudomonadota bacterium]
MSKYSRVLAVLPLMIAFSARAEDTALRNTFEQRYAVMKAAIDTRDEKALAAMLTPDFVNRDVSGETQNAAQMVEELRRLPEDPRKTTTTTLHSITAEGNRAVIEQLYDMKTSKATATGDIKNFELRATLTDTWVKDKNTWLCRETVMQRVDYIVNGQVVAHKERPPGS